MFTVAGYSGLGHCMQPKAGGWIGWLRWIGWLIIIPLSALQNHNTISIMEGDNIGVLKLGHDGGFLEKCHSLRHFP